MAVVFVRAMVAPNRPVNERLNDQSNWRPIKRAEAAMGQTMDEGLVTAADDPTREVLKEDDMRLACARDGHYQAQRRSVFCWACGDTAESLDG